MEIFILHGENTVNAYDRLKKYLEAAKSKNWEVKKITDTDANLKEVLMGESLFAKDRLVIIEETKILTSDNLTWLKKNAENINANLLIFHKGTLPQRTIKALPKVTKIEVFKITKLMWTFLDSFFPGNTKTAYRLFHEAVKTDAPEFVFAMLTRHLRDVYWAKADAKTLDYPSWRKSKLLSQAEKFDKSKLEELIDELSIADIKAKTSQTELTDSLDFLIATHLE